ncbi:UNVERIFIED_CONTAM: hypothetical protein PYX00_011912 [Menopon gallinae]|uniref:Queuine tRNA-ribosyltransferase catalytic subunit 1 n=1 Tax=Menopon gallinae TaxID=328185 RepID=A0AAW2H8U8_9NEOP
MIFNISKEDKQSKARLGTLRLAHGCVQTPTFMPVGTQANIKGVFHKDIEDTGCTLILANTYHVYLRPGVEVITQAGGLHGFSSWKHNILTDSGGFQIFSLKGLRKIKEEGVYFQSHIDGSAHFLSPEKVVDLQTAYNSDIQMILDVCTPPNIPYAEALEALKITTQWARRGVQRWHEKRQEGYKGQLFTIIQGNFYKDLRVRSAEEILELDTPGLAIGGLSVGEPAPVFHEYLAFTVDLMPKEKPRYVMGIGTIDYILSAVANGIDMFDCVNPTRIARHATAMTRRGNLSLKAQRFEKDFRPLEEDCTCPVCQRYCRAFIRHLFKSGEILGQMLLSLHNLSFLTRFMQEIRKSLEEDRFTAFKKEALEQYYGK